MERARLRKNNTRLSSSVLASFTCVGRHPLPLSLVSRNDATNHGWNFLLPVRTRFSFPPSGTTKKGKETHREKMRLAAAWTIERRWWRTRQHPALSQRRETINRRDVNNGRRTRKRKKEKSQLDEARNDGEKRSVAFRERSSGAGCIETREATQTDDKTRGKRRSSSSSSSFCFHVEQRGDKWIESRAIKRIYNNNNNNHYGATPSSLQIVLMPIVNV